MWDLWYLDYMFPIYNIRWGNSLINKRLNITGCKGTTESIFWAGFPKLFERAYLLPFSKDKNLWVFGKQSIRLRRQKEWKKFRAEECKTMLLLSEMYFRLRKSLCTIIRCVRKCFSAVSVFTLLSHVSRKNYHSRMFGLWCTRGVLEVCREYSGIFAS